MISFLEKTAAHLIREYGDTLSKMSIVFPNKRASLFFQDYLSKNTTQPIWAPKIYGIEDFVVELSGFESISNLPLLFSFYNVYKAQEGDNADSFGEFSSWASILLHDFNELDLHLVDSKQFFSYIHEVRAIENWNLDNDKPSPIQLKYREFWKKADLYYEELSKSLKASGFLYNGMAFRLVAENIEQLVQSNQSLNNIVFAGFNALSAAEECIFKSLNKHGKAITLWDSDEYYMNDEKQEAGLFLRRYKKSWSAKNFDWIENTFAKIEKKIEVIGVAQHAGQAKVAGNILANQKDSNFQNTALVLADEGLLTPVLQSLPRKVQETNVTMGYSLKNASIYGLFESIINLYLNKNQKGFYYDDFLKLIHQNYFSISFNSKQKLELNELVKRIKEENIIFIQYTELKEQQRQIPFLKELNSIENVETLLELFLLLINELKQFFSTKKSKQYLIELEYLFSFYQLINQFLSLSKEYPYIDSIKTFKTLFREAAHIETIDFKGEPLKGLQIMGVLETRNLDFKRVILLSANEGILPAGKTHNSFISHDIKKKFKLPSYREKDAMFAYHFYRLLQKAEEIYLIYNTETDEFGSGERSRFIAQIQHELPQYGNHIRLVDRVTSTKIHASSNTGVEIPKSEKIIKKIESILKKGISPTAIITYINCPLDFYYKYILGLKEEETVEETIALNSLGSVIHEVLEKLFKPLENKEVVEQDLKNMQSKIKALTEKAFLKDFSKENLSFGKNLLSYEVACKYISDFITNETNAIKSAKNNIWIRSVEKKTTHSFTLNVSQKTVEVNLLGKADRIDEINGITRIMDYKSGRVEPNELKVKEITELFSNTKYNKALQVLLYAFLFNKESGKTDIQSGVISFRKLNEGFMMLKDNDSPFINNDLLQNFEKELHLFLKKMLDPSEILRHNSDSHYCEFCS